MSADWIRPFLPDMEPPKRSLVDELADLFRKMWDENRNNFRALATSTHASRTVEGTVTIDKHITAWLMKQEAGPGTRVGDASVYDITRVLHCVTRRFGLRV
jgi:hypothetical protein